MRLYVCVTRIFEYACMCLCAYGTRSYTALRPRTFSVHSRPAPAAGACSAVITVRQDALSRNRRANEFDYANIGVFQSVNAEGDFLTDVDFGTRLTHSPSEACEELQVEVALAAGRAYSIIPYASFDLHAAERGFTLTVLAEGADISLHAYSAAGRVDDSSVVYWSGAPGDVGAGNAAVGVVPAPARGARAYDQQLRGDAHHDEATLVQGRVWAV